MRKYSLIPIFLFIAWGVHAVLTTDVLGAHLIRAINRGFTQGLLTDQEQIVLCQIIYKCAVDYIPNGGYDTLANRKEAMKEIGESLFQLRTGLDPTSGTVSDGNSARHRFIRHWLQGDLGIDSGTVNGIENEN
jgi:hypothetical protein